MAQAKSPEFNRPALAWLLFTGLLATAWLARELPTWVNLLFVTTVAWRYSIERFHVFRPNRWLRYLLLLAVLYALLREYGSILGYRPGLALLVALMGLKLLELRGLRDAMLTLFLFYVVVLGGFLFDQTLPGALWAIGTVTTSLVALIRLQHMMTARVALGMAGELMLKALPLLLILYALFPRLGSTLWGMPTEVHAGQTGMSEEMRPGSINALTQSSEIALRVDFLTDTPPPTRELYWRGMVLWETDGRSWRRGTSTATPEKVRSLGTPVQYRVTQEPSNNEWLYALDMPIVASKDVRLRAGLTLISLEPIRERTSYTLTSSTRYSTGELRPLEQQAALRLPRLSPRVRAFADELRRQYHDPAELVRAVLMHFRRENFVYTLAPPLLGNDPVDQFLFDTRRGFCEHYASAFATLMRAVGVPARVVVGYQGGELNPAGNYLIVRESDAHAWTEVWLAERGWVRVDPTAAVAPERVELGLDAIRRLEAQGLVPGAMGSALLAKALELPWFEYVARRVRLYWDYTNIAWYRWVIDYQKDRQESLLRRLGFETIDWTQVMTILGGTCLAVLLGYAAWSRRLPPPDRVQRIYLRFCRKLARAGIARAAHEGPADFAERAGGVRPDLGQTLNAVTARYLMLRYGKTAGNDDLREFKRAVNEFHVR
ncbi:MAG: DUF3488 domain-containing transglutaminase family protein [Gammaproteobacteria bacterium]|nr:DUF3488 domain-containing transglutaminase family protein [Gammaproteobacteria bacterium]